MLVIENRASLMNCQFVLQPYLCNLLEFSEYLSKVRHLDKGVRNLKRKCLDHDEIRIIPRRVAILRLRVGLDAHKGVAGL
jgi:hypothetical protein